MKIDLRNDVQSVMESLKERVANFDANSNNGPGDGEIVSQIDLGYSYDQSGWIAIVFDTREDPDCDGNWTLHLEDEDNLVYFDHWCEALEKADEEGVTFIDTEGNEHEFSEYPGEETAAELIGEMLQYALLDAKKQGVFDALPTAEVCHIGVGDQLGAWGWPMYDDRGKSETIL